MNLRRYVVLLLLLSGLIGPAGCSDDKEENHGVDPLTPFPATMPSPRSMELEINDLYPPDLAASPAGACHALTTVVVGWINLNLAARLALPEAVLAACLQQPSVYLGNSRWQWTATGGQGAGTWTAVLTANVIIRPTEPDDGVWWEMRISGTTLALDDALWFDGECDLNAGDGSWVFYDPQSGERPKEVIRCRWTLSAGSNPDALLTFEAVDAGAAIYGDELTYALSDSIGSIEYLDASASGRFQARWNLSDGSGRAIGAESDSCCWGSRDLLYPDVDCP